MSSRRVVYWGVRRSCFIDHRRLSPCIPVLPSSTVPRPYLSYSNRYADLLFELISRRYQSKSTIITTNTMAIYQGLYFFGEGLGLSG